MDPSRHAAPTGMPVGIPARDDVFRDFRRQIGGILLVEVDDRRDVAGDVGGEEFLDLHSAKPQE